MRRRSRALALALAWALGSCGRADAPPAATLAIVTGDPAGDAAAGCELAEWTAPRGESYRMCMDPSTAVEITRRDLYALRIEDRKYGEETWYRVSAHLVHKITEPLWKTLQSNEKLYAVLVDGKVSVVQPGFAIAEPHTLLAAMRELAEADAFASQWDAPVDRRISQEIAAQPAFMASLVQLIAAPERWVGRRVSVAGYLSDLNRLFLSREHAETWDVASGASLAFRSAEDAEATSRCGGQWVEITGVVDRDRGGSAELTHIQRVWIVSKGEDCLPAEPRSRP